MGSRLMPAEGRRGRRAGMMLARLLFACALAGCAAPTTPTPAPVRVPRIAVTPWHAPRVVEWARTYQGAYGPLPFDLEIVQAGVALAGVREGTYALAIGTFTPEDSWFATPLGEEVLAVMVDPGEAVRDLTRSELAALLAGRVTKWSASGKDVLPVLPLPGDDVRGVLEQGVMRGAGFASAARLVASPEQALEVQSADPGTLLLLPVSALPADATPVTIDGRRPGHVADAAEQGYPLLAARVALALEEPGGGIRDWLVWIQATELAADSP